LSYRSSYYFSAASTAITLVFFAMFGYSFLLTQYFQFVLGYSALQAGVRLLPLALTLMVVAPTSARIVEKVGTIELSNVTLVCPESDKATRVGIRVEGDKKKRFCKQCEATID